MEFEVFSAALPVVAADEVVQFVSGFAPEGVVEDCAAAAPATSNPANTAAVKRKIMVVSRDRDKHRSNPCGQRSIGSDGSIIWRSGTRQKIANERAARGLGERAKFDLHQGVTGNLARTFQTAGGTA